jgi:hypothetical protein
MESDRMTISNRTRDVSAWLFRDAAPEPIATGLTWRRRRREHRIINRLLRTGRRKHAFDDGTVNVLDGHIAAREAQIGRRLDGETLLRRHRAARNIARAAKRIERGQARLNTFETRLARIDDHVARTEAILLGKRDAAVEPRSFQPLTGPTQLSGYALRTPLSKVAQPDERGRGTVSRIRSQPESSDR